MVDKGCQECFFVENNTSKLMKTLRAVMKDFEQPKPTHYDSGLPLRGRRISASEVPPHMVYVVLHTLLGFRECAREEKVLFVIPVRFRGQDMIIEYTKFGLSISSTGQEELIDQVIGKLKQAARLADGIMGPIIMTAVSEGRVTIRNKYHFFRDMYEYFRDKAKESFRRPPPRPKVLKRDEDGRAMAVESNPMLYKRRGVFYSQAMLDAYFSCLEHTLVLCLPFRGFRAEEDTLRELIRDGWIAKFKRIVDLEHDKAAHLLFMRLNQLKEKYRNTLAHGGFEKSGGLLYVHHLPIGAIPIQLSQFDQSIHFSILPLDEPTFQDVCDVLDECDQLLNDRAKYAMQYIQGGLDVSFSPESVAEYEAAMESDDAFLEFLDFESDRQDRATNMDW